MAAPAVAAAIAGGTQAASGISGSIASSVMARKQREMAKSLADREYEEYLKTVGREEEQRRLDNERADRELALKSGLEQRSTVLGERSAGLNSMQMLAQGRAEAFGNSRQNKIRAIQQKALFGGV